MKKLLLLSALLIFACSSDDSSDNNSNQNFLQKYDDVTWYLIENTDPSPDLIGAPDYWVTFNPNGFDECNLWGFNDSEYSGNTVNWGEVTDNHLTYTVIENSPERLVIEIIDTGDGETFTWNYTVEVTNNGNSFEGTQSNNVYIQYFDRVSSNPCN